MLIPDIACMLAAETTRPDRVLAEREGAVPWGFHSTPTRSNSASSETSRNSCRKVRTAMPLQMVSKQSPGCQHSFCLEHRPQPGQALVVKWLVFFVPDVQRIACCLLIFPETLLLYDLFHSRKKSKVKTFSYASNWEWDGVTHNARMCPLPHAQACTLLSIVHTLLLNALKFSSTAARRKFQVSPAKMSVWRMLHGYAGLCTSWLGSVWMKSCWC